MNDECVICFDEINKKNIINLTCNHSFHKECIITLVRKRNRKCPLCRNRITWTVNSMLNNDHDKKRKRVSVKLDSNKTQKLEI